MPDVLINCSLSNASAVIFVHASDYSVYQEGDGECKCVGFYHPHGPDAVSQWKRDHPLLAKHMMDGALEASLESSADPEPVIEPEPVVEPVAELESGVDPEPAQESDPEPEVGTDPEPENVEFEEVVAEVDKLEELYSLGLPDSCLDELAGAGLFTKGAILAFEDLSSIKGIGVKTRDKILSILKGE